MKPLMRSSVGGSGSHLSSIATLISSEQLHGNKKNNQ
jgi:hypothetical protein